MAQSPIYKTGSESVSSTVDVTDDDQRQIGTVTSVGDITNPIDFTEDATRSVGQVGVTNTVDTNVTAPVGLDIPTTAIFDTAGVSGEAGAATLSLGRYRQTVDAWYDVANTNGDIVIEVSESSGGTNWYEIARFSGTDVVTGGNLIQLETSFEYARLWVTSGAADADVNRLVIASKGL